MTGFPNPLSFLIVASIAIPLGVMLRRWYAQDPQRSLLVLCVMLAFVSPWLALAVYVLAKSPGLLFRYGQRIQGN
jgi:peptidoglycan/LPS O-acetylase OafA/YrhL